MRISKNTLSILKNFASLNPNIRFREGNVIKTMTKENTILAEAVVEEIFPKSFSVYELPKLLGVISMYGEDFEVEFGEESLSITGFGGRSTTVYRYSAENMIVAPDARSIKMPSEEIHFSLGEDEFKWVIKTRDILQTPEITVSSVEGHNVYINARDVKNPGYENNTLSVKGRGSGQPFEIAFKSSKFIMMPGEYDITVSSAMIALFECKTFKLKYYVTGEKRDSFYGIDNRQR